VLHPFSQTCSFHQTLVNIVLHQEKSNVTMTQSWHIIFTYGRDWIHSTHQRTRILTDDQNPYFLVPFSLNSLKPPSGSDTFLPFWSPTLMQKIRFHQFEILSVNVYFLDPRLREGPMNSVSSVRTYVRSFVRP